MIIPGTGFWVLVLIGALNDQPALVFAAIGLLVVTFAIVAVTSLQASAKRTAERLRLWTTGTPGTAEVVRIGTDGGGVNGHPDIDFQLVVTVPGRPAYPVALTARVSTLAIPRIQPGCRISVRVDPTDPQQLVIDSELTPYGYA